MTQTLKMCNLFIILLVNCAIIYQAVGQPDIEFVRKSKSFPLFHDDESSFPTPDDPDGDGVIGAAGKHYPTLRLAPPTSFECDGRLPGMYADMETGCQVYHTCQADMRKESNLCVNGTIFNQATFSCDWWYNVDCPSSASFYSLNADLGRQPSNEHHRKGTIEFPLSEGTEKKGHHGIVSLTIPPPPRPTLSIGKNIPNFKLEDIPEPPRPRLLKKIRPPPEIPRPPQFVDSISLRIPNPPKPDEHEVLPPPLPPRPRPVPNVELPKLSRPTHVIENLPSIPLRSIDSGRKPDRHPPKFSSGDGQYDRGTFDPAIHLPRRKLIPEKKFPKISDISSLTKSVKPPQMYPVKSDDVVSGYSDLYLGKPVDED